MGEALRSFFDSKFWESAPGLAWALLALVGVGWLRVQVKDLASVVVERIKKGSSLKGFGVEIGATLNAENVNPVLRDLAERVLDLEVRNEHSSAETPEPDFTVLSEARAGPASEVEDISAERRTARARMLASPSPPSASRVARVYELTKRLEEQREGASRGDPWAGFADDRAGPPESTKSRRLTATVHAIPDQDGLFEINLLLVAEDGALIEHPIGMLLHPTFPQPKRVIQPVNGRAHLRLVAWGAFTVGCIDDHGEHLAINLANLTDAPKAFREK